MLPLRLLPLTLASTTLALFVAISNKCPTSIIPVIKNAQEAKYYDSLAPNAQFTVDDFTGGGAAYVYTPTNQIDGTEPVKLYVNNNHIYYVIGSYPYNTAIDVEVSWADGIAPANCPGIVCDISNCSLAFQERPDTPDPAAGELPEPPFNLCDDLLGVTVTFCPSGHYPSWVFRSLDKCLELPPSEADPVRVTTCDRSPKQYWLIDNDRVRAAGTNRCLDAGSTRENGRPVYAKPCDNSAPQKWSYSDDKFIIEDFCLDVKDVTNGEVQILRCVSQSDSQIWSYEWW